MLRQQSGDRHRAPTGPRRQTGRLRGGGGNSGSQTRRGAKTKVLLNNVKLRLFDESARLPGPAPPFCLLHHNIPNWNHHPTTSTLTPTWVQIHHPGTDMAGSYPSTPTWESGEHLEARRKKALSSITGFINRRGHHKLDVGQ